MTELSPMNISTIPTLWTYLIFLHFSLQNYITPACSLSKEKGGIIVLLQPQQIGVLIFVIVSSSVVNLAKKKGNILSFHAENWSGTVLKCLK
jgi:hypothetical protein